MAKIGYARIRLSEGEDTQARQTEALTKDGCQTIYSDRVFGSKPELPGLEAALARVGKGDVLVVWKLDRLGRTLSQLIHTVADLSERGVALRALDEGIDMTTARGRTQLGVFNLLAAFDNELARVRTRRALDAAIATNRLTGRKPVVTDEKLKLAKKYLSAGGSVRDVASRLKIGKTALYSALRRNKVAES